MKTLEFAKQLFNEGVRQSNLKSTLKRLPKPDREKWLKKEQAIRNHLSDLRLNKQAQDQKKSEQEDAKTLGVSRSEFLELREKAQKVAESLAHSGYSMGELVRVVVTKSKRSRFNCVTIASQDNRQEYANSCKYRPTHGYDTVSLYLSELRDIQIIGGIPTIVHTNDKISKCTVWKSEGSKQYWSIEMSDMYITKTYHAESIEDAIEWRKQEAERMINSRNEKLEWERLQKKFVGFQHAIEAGNCRSGIESFVRRHGLNKDHGYNLGYLMSLEDNYHVHRIAYNIK